MSVHKIENIVIDTNQTGTTKDETPLPQTAKFGNISYNPYQNANQNDFTDFEKDEPLVEKSQKKL